MTDETGDHEDVAVAKVIEVLEDGSMTVSAAAELLGCTRAAINAHIAEDGAPVAFRGRPGVSSRIILGDYVRWLIDRTDTSEDVDPGDDEAVGRLSDDQRYKRARARREELAEMREEISTARELKEVVKVEGAVRFFEDIYSEISASMRNVSKRTAPKVAAMTDIREISNVINREIADAMEAGADSRGAMDRYLKGQR